MGTKYFREEKNENRFVTEIAEIAESGRGLVPLLGSGVSATAGIPIIREIRDYLAWCIWLSLPMEEHLHRPWYPRTDQWPPFRYELSRSLGYWRKKLFESIDTDTARPWLRSLIEQGLGALPDWRSMLQFLARLQVDNISLGRPSRELWLGPKDDTVIDRFFLHIVHDRSPAMAHRMLAQLAQPLRTSIILTTNFDNLIEQAFHEHNDPIVPYDVHLGRRLPTASVLMHRFNLLQLHGGRYGLRADYSLDEKPLNEELEAFLSYFLAANSEQNDHEAKTKRSVERHLLVMGFSADDRRMRAFLEHAWRHSNLRAYWICHTNNDLSRLREFINECQARGAFGASAPARDSGAYSVCTAIRHSNAGLLLLDLYQRRMHELPAADVPFPAISRVPLPPSRFPVKPTIAHRSKAKAERFANFKTRLRAEVDCLRDPDPVRNPYRLVTLTSPPKVYGVTTAAHDLFDDLVNEGRHCLWFDMDDISGSDDLYEQLLEAVADHAGVRSWMPMLQHRDLEGKRGDILEEFTAALGGEWVFFFNAREAPGCNVLHSLSEQPKYDESRYDDNGWLDVDDKRKQQPKPLFDDESSCRRAFLDLLKELCAAKRASWIVVLLCRSPEESKNGPRRNSRHRNTLIDELCEQRLHERSENKQRRQEDSTKKNVETPGKLVSARRVLQLRSDESPFTFKTDDFVTAATKNIPRDDIRNQFLLALCLMQRTRYESACLDDAFHAHDVPREIRIKLTDKWLEHLENSLSIRKKSGGFIWMHCRTRDQLRVQLSRQLGPETVMRTHWLLALWYERLFYASQSPSAAFEAGYHALQCAAVKADAKPAGLDRELTFVHRLLTEAEAHILESGFSKGTCRRLTYIRDGYLTRIERRLKGRNKAGSAAYIVGIKRRCTDTMAKLAREVAENGTAYYRYRQIAELMIRSSIDSKHRRSDKSYLEAKNDDSLSMIEQLKSVPEHNNASVRGAYADWWRHIGILGIASRAYTAADSAFRISRRWLKQDEASPIAAAKLAVRSLQLSATRCEMYRRLGDGNKFEKDARNAAASFKRAEEILRKPVRSRPEWRDFHNQMRRAYTYYASVLILKMKYDAAQAMLTRAERHWRVIESGPLNLPLGVIEVSRADSYLEHAKGLIGTEGSTVTGLLQRHKWSYGLVRSGSSSTEESFEWTRKIIGVERKRLKTQFTKSGETDLQTASALLNDADGALDRAAMILMRYRKNVWWSTWYFERRLRLIELSIWVAAVRSVVGNSTSSGTELHGLVIPYLGLEATPLGTESAAEEFLRLGERMVRLDVYRMATILEGFLGCVRAFHVAVQLDERLIAIHSQRQAALIERAHASAARLLKVRDLRIAEDVNETKHPLDADVDRYVWEIICQAHKERKTLMSLRDVTKKAL